MTSQEKARIKALIENPPPGSKIAAAKEYGVDLYLNLRRLDMTPKERFLEMQRAADFLSKMRNARRMTK